MTSETKGYRYAIVFQHVIREKERIYSRTNNYERALELQKEAVEAMYKENQYNNYVVVIKDTTL